MPGSDVGRRPICVFERRTALGVHPLQRTEKAAEVRVLQEEGEAQQDPFRRLQVVQ